MRYLLVLYCFLITLTGFAQNAKIDSLNKVIETTTVDTVKGRTLCALCWELRKIGEIEQALKYASEGLHLLKQKDKRSTANCLNSIGVISAEQANYPKALQYFNQGLVISEQIRDDKTIADCLNNMATIYLFQGNHLKAIAYYQRSLNINRKRHSIKGIAECLSNIALIYDNQYEYAKALNNFKESLKYFEQIQYKFGIATAYLNIGSMYYKLDRNAQALDYLMKGVEISKENNFQSTFAQCLNNIGDIHQGKGDYLVASDYFLQSLAISNKLGDKAMISESYSNIALNLLLLHQAKISKKYARNGLLLAQEIQHLQWMRQGALVSYKADSALGDWKSAFEHHQLFKQYSDSLNNEDKAKEFGRVESKYQFEKEAEEAKRKQEAQAKIEGEKTERRNNLQYLTIFAGLIGLFAGLVFIGKFSIPTRVIDIAVFAGLLILFEFFLILFDPLFDQYSGGIPFYKLGFNTVVAFGFAPLHGFLEDKLKKRLVKTEKV